MVPTSFPRPVDDWDEAIEATFRRIHRPLRWPMETFRRRKVSAKGFVGYRFSRVRRSAVAGFGLGFLLNDGALGIAADPPETVAYAFVRPVRSSLYADLVSRPRSAVRRLVRAAEAQGVPFEFRAGEEIAAIRHRSLPNPPPEIFVLAASDFFMLTYHPLRSSGFLEAVRKATTRAGP